MRLKLFVQASYLLLFIILTFNVVSCNNDKGEPAGGPCTYDKKYYPATVIDIDKKDSLNADIIFRVSDLNGNIYRDSVSWYIEKKEWTLFSKIEKDSILVGKKYMYEVWEMTDGACNPHVEILKLEAFK